MPKKSLGQYFTKNVYLQDELKLLIKNNPKLILEPSMGRGDLVDSIIKDNKKIKFDLYEIDSEIKVLESIKKFKINYTDFLKTNISKKYKTIIGNPPYVRTKTGNLYIDFINKCVDLLDDNGELIFIIPSDFLKLTSSGDLLNKMLKNGNITDVIHPESETLFENANINIIILRYELNKELNKKVMYNKTEKMLLNSNGIITFTDKIETDLKRVGDYFDIYVGMVSGKDSVFKNNKFGNINILCKKNCLDKFIYVEDYPSKNKELNKYLESNKELLKSRKIRKFNETNWYQWGAPRNKKAIENNLNKECIYVSNITRQKEIAFKDKVRYFGGSLLLLIPKVKIKSKYLDKMVEYLNNESFKKNYMYSGRFKIGHKQISNHLFKGIPGEFE